MNIVSVFMIGNAHPPKQILSHSLPVVSCYLDARGVNSSSYEIGFLVVYRKKDACDIVCSSEYFVLIFRPGHVSNRVMLGK